MPLFTPEPDDIRGINDLYDGVLRPRLEELEAQRLKKIRAKKARFAAFVAILAGCTVFFLFGSGILHSENELPVPVLFVVLFPAIVIPLIVFNYRLATSSTNDFNAARKAFVVGEIASFFGFQYAAEGTPEIVRRFENLSLIPAYDYLEASDSVSGLIGWLGFQMTDVHLQQENRKVGNFNWLTVFRGTLLEMDYPKRFNGTTIILFDKGAVMNLLELIPVEVERVRLEDPVFEREFQVYSDDQIEARYLLPPMMMERCLELSRGLKGLSLAFHRNDILAAFDGNLLEVGSSTGRIDDIDAIRRTVLEMRLALTIAETLGIANASVRSRPT